MDILISWIEGDEAPSSGLSSSFQATPHMVCAVRSFGDYELRDIALGGMGSPSRGKCIPDCFEGVTLNAKMGGAFAGQVAGLEAALSKRQPQCIRSVGSSFGRPSSKASKSYPRRPRCDFITTRRLYLARSANGATLTAPTMPQPVNLVRPTPIRTATIKAKVPRMDLARFVPAACGEVWSYVRSAGLMKPGRHVALYGAEEGYVEVGVEIGEAFVGNGRVCCSELPTGAAATATHFGPYHRLGEAHVAVREWCGAQGHEVSGTCWEVYDHWQDRWNTDPSLIRTDVFHLLRNQPN